MLQKVQKATEGIKGLVCFCYWLVSEKICIRWWWFLEKIGKDLTHYSDYQSVRRYIGGRWGLWEINSRRWGLMKVWIQSECRHYPPPPLVNSTEPLEVEEYYDHSA